ncbi:MAG: hypothetical protein ACP5I4_13105 [Oceanipulchritudo sp.]
MAVLWLRLPCEEEKLASFRPLGFRPVRLPGQPGFADLLRRKPEESGDVPTLGPKE